MKEFTSAACRTLRKDLESVLEVLEDQHNIKIDIGKMSYGQTIGAKLTVSLPDADGNTFSVDETAYNKVSTQQLTTNGIKYWKKLGDFFGWQNETYKVVGWKPYSRKYPLLGINKHGKTYKFPAECADAKKYCITLDSLKF